MSAENEPRAVVTRFAPSPTGFLHIGNARTGLFSWLYARHHGGKALLRIEDTDKARSTQAAIDVILDGLTWLGIDWDGDAVFQSERVARHAEVAQELLARGQAYRCYMTQAELAASRAAAQAERRPFRLESPWRDCSPDAPAPDAPFVVRLKAPREGETAIDDLVQGRVTVSNSELDDMVLLRSDGTPTYMLAVVVDDHDMGVTHVIRGDDHLNNAFRQLGIVKAMGWPEPVYAHIPLIHGPDGAKLSKRHGALGVDAYRDELGILPEALFNYLLRLGWGHGDDEIISKEQAIDWFDLAARRQGAVALRHEEARESQRPLYPRGERRQAGRARRAAARGGARPHPRRRRHRAADPGDAASSSRARATSTSWPTAPPSCSSPARSISTRRPSSSSPATRRGCSPAYMRF